LHRRRNSVVVRTTSIATALVTLIAVLLMVSPAGPVLAETKPTITVIGVPEPRAFLFVGNSYMYYNNSMHNMFLRVARQADPETPDAYRATSATVSGAGLNWHDMESYFRPGALAEYSFVADNEVQFNEFDKLFDVVIMMDCSQCPINPRLQDRFHEYVAKHSATVVRNGARPVLFMTWAYENRPEMTAALAEQYTIAGNENNALVIPAGLAFAKARGKRPDIRLYQPDQSHPSLAGTYLAALTCYAAIFRKPPDGDWMPEGIAEDTARFLQAVAWETVQDYYVD
jgi:hypothetical protein